MVMDVRVNSTRAYREGTASERAANITSKVQEEWFETDTGNTYECVTNDGSGTLTWQQSSSSGMALVADGFKPSSYSGNVSVTTTVSGQSEAVPTGAGRVRIRNIGATNYALVAFGTDASDAETNAASGVLVEVDTTEILGIPANATHLAYVADTGTVTLNITWGA